MDLTAVLEKTVSPGKRFFNFCYRLVGICCVVILGKILSIWQSQSQTFYIMLFQIKRNLKQHNSF